MKVSILQLTFIKINIAEIFPYFIGLKKIVHSYQILKIKFITLERFMIYLQDGPVE